MYINESKEKFSLERVSEKVMVKSQKGTQE